MANMITIIRIILSVLLIVPFFNIVPFSTLFIIVYLLCGLSDVLDGYVARKIHCESEFGAKLDSVADLIFMIVISYIIVPKIIVELLSMQSLFHLFIIIIMTFMIMILKVSAMIIIYRRFNTITIIHTYGNKLMGGLLYILPLVINRIEVYYFLYTLCIIGILVAIEEIVIGIKFKKLNLNSKGILFEKINKY